jgi:hypothetical protein
MIDKDNYFLVRTIFNYFDTRILGDLYINEIHLKSRTGKIDLKITTEKRLSELGIDYKLSNIDKVIFFTKDTT